MSRCFSWPIKPISFFSVKWGYIVALKSVFVSFRNTFCHFGKPRMNKGVGGGIGGAGSGSGPTAAAAAAAAQKQKALLQRVETDVSSLVDSFTVLVNVARV